MAAQTVNRPGIFFKSIILKNFFGLLITISYVNEKKMKHCNLKTLSKKCLLQPTPNYGVNKGIKHISKVMVSSTLPKNCFPGQSDMIFGLSIKFAIIWCTVKLPQSNIKEFTMILIIPIFSYIWGGYPARGRGYGGHPLNYARYNCLLKILI